LMFLYSEKIVKRVLIKIKSLPVRITALEDIYSLASADWKEL
jgi:hypothetical protein